MNEFFAKAELLAGLSETEQTELRTNIGLNTIIDDLSNDTVNTKGLTVSDGVLIDTSNLQLKLGEMTSNMFLKSVTSDGKAVWSPLPTYDEMIGATMDAITQDLFDDLSKLRNLKVEDRLHIQCNLTQPSVLVNEDSNGLTSWSQLESNFENCNLSSNNIPNMLALGDLYKLTLSNDSNIYSNLYEVATDTSLVLTLSNNLSELSNNLPEIMSNLGLDINFTTSNLLTSNVFASNIETESIIAKTTIVTDQSRTSNLLVHDDATVSGRLQSKDISASNISYSNLLQGKDILASNISIRSSLFTSNLSASNVTTSNVSLKNIHFDILSASNNEILTIMNSNIAFKQLNSDYLANSEDSIPSSKALNDALQFMDTRVRTITNDPTFAETYIQINCNLDEIKYYTVENMLKLHSNLRISRLAREPTWENIENIPSDLANLGDFYLTKDLSNIDLGDINVLKLRSSLALEEMAYQNNDSVDIRGGFIKASRVETDNFMMTDSEDNVEDDRINYRDENYLFMRHAGYEGENAPGTGKWGNLPIKQYYTDVGKHSIPSCEALSNLYAYVTSSDRTVESMNENGETIAQFKQGFLNQAYRNQNSTSNAASTKALTDLYNFMRDSTGGDDGLLNTNYKHQSSHTNAASTKALSDLHSFMRNSAGGDDGFLNPEYKGQSSDTNAATTKALSEFHDFVRGSNGGDEGLLNTQYKDQTSHSNAASTKALTDLYNFTRDSRGGDDGLLNTHYKNQSSHTNAASTKALSDLHSFMRNSAGGDDGFLNPEYKGQSSDTNAATTKALSEFHDFVRGSNGGDEGLLNTQYKDQTSHSNAASTKALSDLHDYLRSSDENGYLMRDFSNQTSHSNAATAKSVTDLFNYIIDGFLVKDFTEGNAETAATSGAVFNLFQYMQSSQYIADVLNDNSESKVVSAKTLSNLYYQNLASEDFFKIHNSYIFEDYLKQSINDKSSTQPFSSTATSNVIHDMITERRKLYNALNGDGVLNNQINNNDFGKIATAQSVYYLSNNTRNEINKLNDSIYDNLTKTETNISIFDRIGLSSSNTNPLEILQTNDCNIDIGLKYNPKYFTLTGSGQFTLDDTAISNIAASAIKIRSSSDNGGFSNLIEVDPVGDGEYEIKFRGTSLLDEISGDVAKSVADAILNYGEGDYTFSCNLWVKQNLTVYSNIHASNVYFSNVEVASNFVSSNIEVSNSLLVYGSANFESNLTILSNLTVSGDTMIEGYQKIASTLSVSENMYVDDEIRVFSNAFIGGHLSVREDLNVSGPAFLDKSLSVADELFSKSIEISSKALINGELIANYTTTSNLVSKNIETVNTEIMSNLTFTSAYHDAKIYATNPDGSFGNNNLYLEANNVDKIVYSNIRNIVFGEDQSRIYIGGELSVNTSSAVNLNVSGPSVFDEVITGTINNTEHVLADKAVESSMTDQRYFPVAIDRTDGDAPFKELHPFSNMHFDKNLNVNIHRGLSVKNSITSGALSVAQLDFDSLGGSVQVHGQNIFGTVPNASNVYVNRIISDTDASYYNLSMVKYDLTHDVLERKNRVIEFGTNMVYQPSENLLSVGQISAENGYNIEKINASALSTGSPVDLNPYINITQDNLLKVDANLSVSHSGESTLANTISVAQKNNTGGYDEQLVFTDQEDGTLTVRPEVTFEVDGLDYGIKVNTTKIMNNHVYASEIHGTTLKIGNTSNDPLYISSDGLVDAREVSAGRLIIQEGSEFSGVGKPGELKFASGKFFGHDGTKFTSISSATVNDEETGMFVTEGKHDIDFRCTSNGTPFDLRLRSNLVNIPNTLSVKDVYVYDNTIVKSLILRDNIKQKKCPSIHMTQNEISGYVASGSSTLSFQNDYYKCFDGKDVTYDDFDDGTGHYSAWISQTTYDHISGLPLADVAPTFPGTEKRGEFCMLKLPSPILLKQFHIYTRGSATYENATPPKDICLYATNNGIDWEELGSFKDLIFTGREGLRLGALQLPDADIEGEYKKFNQFAIQVECITVQGNKPAYCAIGKLVFYTQDESATYTDLDDRLEGLPGQLVYSDGKILCHDGTSFKQITGSTANMDRTGMFLVEGESNIKFRANSDSNARYHFDVKFDEEKAEFGSNVLIKNDLSVGGITTFSGHMIPSAADAFDIGSVDNAVRDLFISDNSLWVGDTTKISFTNGKMKFRKRKRNIVPSAILSAGLSKGHVNHEATKTAALQHAGVSSLEEMKLAHWARYMRTLEPQATVGDIFRRDHDEDYELTASSESWYEIDDTKMYTTMAVGIQTSDPQEALHVNGKIRVEDGFSLIKQGSDSNETNPALVIDTNFFGADTEVVDRTSYGIASFTKLFRIYGRTSEGVGRSWHWGIPNDDSEKLGLAWDGGGTPDPDVGFMFTTNGDFYANQFYGTLKGNADTANSATRLTTPVTINGVDFDGSKSIDISVTADAIRSELDTRYIRKDSDTVASFAWAKSDAPNIKLQNSAHSTWLYLGGADGGKNTDNIARIRSASAGDLVADSAANANLYLNWHSSGIINLGGYTKVRGHFCVTGDAPNTGYHMILNGLRPTTTSGGAVHFINGPNRSQDGGVNTYTIRNDSGNLRLGRSGSTTRIEGNVEFEDVGAVRSRIGCANLAGDGAQNFSANNIYIGNSTSRGLRAVSGNYGTVQTTGEGAGGWEGYSIAGRYVFMSDNDNNCGIFNDLDNQWMAYFARNGASHLYHNGADKLKTRSDGVNVTGDLLVGRVGFGNDIGYRIEKSAGDYMTVTTQGSKGSWGGYNIQNQWGLMAHTNGNHCGIYNDQDNEWGIHCDRNSYTRLYYNGGEKLRTEDWGVRALGRIYQDDYGYLDDAINAKLHNNNNYNIHDSWLRENGDNSHFKIYGNSRTVVCRTDGSSAFGNNGDYPWIWLYGGDNSGNRRMILHNNGQLWTSNYGWLHEKFHPKMGDNYEIHSSNFIFQKGNSGNASHISYSTNGDWYIRSNNSAGKVIIQDSGGNLGVGTSSPKAKLHVSGTGSYGLSSAKRSWFSAGGSVLGYRDGTWNADVSIYASRDIISGDHMGSSKGSFTSSDRRIKTNIVDIDDASALETLLLLKPKTYTYKDTIGRGEDPVVYGFIAQEVQETLPYSTIVKNDFIPNIYEVSNISNSNVVTFTNFNTADLVGKSSQLRIKNNIGDDKDVNIVEVIDEKSLRVDEDLTEFSKTYDENGNLVSSNIVFVYGEEVDDFLNLKKEVFHAISVSSIQELHRRLEADKTRIVELETQIQILNDEKLRLLESKLESTESKLESTESKLESTESTLASVLERLTALEN